jgi:tRNA(fMet)-specific endonuclease VapC
LGNLAGVVADSDVLLDFINGRDPWAHVVDRLLADGALSTTAITRYELTLGVRDDRRGRLTSQLLDALETLPLDVNAASRAAETQRDLRRAGTPIDVRDCLIAGTVLQANGVLATRNISHFSRIPGLRIQQA